MVKIKCPEKGKFKTDSSGSPLSSLFLFSVLLSLKSNTETTRIKAFIEKHSEDSGQLAQCDRSVTLEKGTEF